MTNTNNKLSYFWVGFGLAILGTVLFASKSIFIKYAYLAGSNATQVLFLRMIFSAPIYVFILLWYLNKLSLEQKKYAFKFNTTGQIILLGFIGYYLASLLDLKGLELISAQLERLILFTYPIMVTILSYLLFKQKITIKTLMALLVSYLGISLIYLQESQQTSTNLFIGVLLVTLSALSYAFYVIISKNIIAKVGSIWFTSIAMLSSSLFIFIHFGIYSNLNQLIWTQEILIWTFMLAIFCTVLPSFMISEAIHRIGASQVSIMGSIGPVVTIILATSLLGEAFTIWHLLGISLVMLGVSIIGYYK